MAGTSPDNAPSSPPPNPGQSAVAAAPDPTQAQIDAALAAAKGTDSPSATAVAEPNSDPAAVTSSAASESAAPADATQEKVIGSEQPTAVEAASTDPPLAGDSWGGSVPLDLPDFGGTRDASANSTGIELLSDVELDVKIELGRAQMRIEDVLKLGDGAVVELDKLAGDPVDVLVNDRLVARGEVLVLNENFCVRISEIIAGASESIHAE